MGASHSSRHQGGRESESPSRPLTACSRPQFSAPSIPSNVDVCSQCDLRALGMVDDYDGCFYCTACWGVYLAERALKKQHTAPARHAGNDRSAAFARELQAPVRPTSSVPRASSAREQQAPARPTHFVRRPSFAREQQARPSTGLHGNRPQSVSSALESRALPSTRARSRRHAAKAGPAYGSGTDSDSDSDQADATLLPSVQLNAMDTQRSCWRKYDEEYFDAEEERRKAEESVEHTREALRSDLFDVRRDRMEDDYYHAQRAAGKSHIEADHATRDLSPRCLEDLQRELARIERSDEEASSVEEGEEPLQREYADYYEDGAKYFGALEANYYSDEARDDVREEYDTPEVAEYDVREEYDTPSADDCDARQGYDAPNAVESDGSEDSDASGNGVVY